MNERRMPGLSAVLAAMAALWVSQPSSGLAGARSLVLASDSSWGAFTGDPMPGSILLGPAQPVCLNATTPAACPAGAVLYGAAFPGAWSADLTTLPGAQWVWAPGVTGAMVPADGAEVWLSKSLLLPRAPLSAILALAADDRAELVVNGIVAGAVGSVTDGAGAAQAQVALTAFDVTSLLVPGMNRISVHAMNGPASFAGCSPGACTYQEDPAGVVFGGVLSFNRPPVCTAAYAAPHTAWPPNHKPVAVAVRGVTDPDGDPVRITLEHIAQDEPVDGSSGMMRGHGHEGDDDEDGDDQGDGQGEGGGSTCPDASGIGTSQATVLAERSGAGDGRVYHLFFRAEDGFGGLCRGEVTVCVPHDQGHGGGCGDGGALVDSTVCRDEPVCDATNPASCEDGDRCTVDTCTPAGCVHGPVTCDDGDPCTADACVAGQCQHMPLQGYDSCSCRFDDLHPQPPACDGHQLPAVLVRLIDDARQLVIAAPGREDPRHARPKVRRAVRRLERAGHLLGRARQKGLPPECVDTLVSQLRAARTGAHAWLHAR